MTPLTDVAGKDYERASKILELAEVDYSVPQSERVESFNKDRFIYVPSIGLYVAKERSHLGKNWNQAHEALSEEGQRMLNLREFTEFLKYTQEHNPEVFESITQIRTPWRAEHLDAYFEKREDGLYVLTGNKTSAEKLGSDNLMKSRRTSGISLESWILNPTEQGLPRSNVEKGYLYYWAPRDESIAWFVAGSGRFNLCFDWHSLNVDADLGVRAAKLRE